MEFCEIAWQQHSFIYNVIMMTQWILFCLFMITFSFSLKINASILFLLPSSNFNNKPMLIRTSLLTAVWIWTPLETEFQVKVVLTHHSLLSHAISRASIQMGGTIETSASAAKIIRAWALPVSYPCVCSIYAWSYARFQSL